MTREFREYERASTTALAAYVQPVIDRYLKEFEREFDARSFTGRFSLMQSNGGRLPASGMAENAITSLFSGPAAGVMGAIRQSERSGYSNLITFDMGGTSTDVCLVRDGVPVLTSDAEIDGLPIRTPVLDIVTVGAGGGSIVWRDDGGMLRVGPRSAGAEPGPACYRRGGTEPTITDAHIVRGTVLADTFLGGRMDVDPALAREAFGVLSEQLGRSEEQSAADRVREQFAEMRTGAEAAFAELGITSALRFTHTLEMRYIGQAFEVPVTLDEDEIASLDAAFLRAIQRSAPPDLRVRRFTDESPRDRLVPARYRIAAPLDSRACRDGGRTAFRHRHDIRCRRTARGPAGQPGGAARRGRGRRAAAHRGRHVHRIRPAGLACAGRCASQRNPDVETGRGESGLTRPGSAGQN